MVSIFLYISERSFFSRCDGRDYPLLDVLFCFLSTLMLLYYFMVVDNAEGRVVMNTRRAGGAAVACLASLLFVFQSTFAAFPTLSVNHSTELLKYEVNGVLACNFTHTIQIRNSAFQKIVGGELWVPIVRNETARHFAVLYNVSSEIGQPTFQSDSSGNEYAYWNNVEIDAGQTLTIELKYNVLSFDVSYVVNSSLAGDFNTSSPLYHKYVQPEDLIQSNDPRIIAKVQEITSVEDSPYEKIGEIYEFVVEHVQYVLQDEERGALWALVNGTGDCSEHSYLFVALCRAAGIPSRVQTGFVFHSVDETLEDGHMWAEYYLENYGWVPVDPTWRMFNKLDAKHLGTMQSVPDTIPYANYFFQFESGPDEEEVTDEQTISLKRCSVNVFGDDFMEMVEETVLKMSQAKSAAFLQRILGMPVVFPSNAADVDQTLSDTKIQLQSAIETWDIDRQFAQSQIASAYENAQSAYHEAGMLIVYAFTIFVGVSLGSALIFVSVTRLFQTRRKNTGSQA